jgi:8-hydroxy-5-deazaflavin:NADPH oxidoreductase
MSKQHVAIIGGTGDQGKGLAIRWALSGFAVTLGSRDVERAGTVAEQLRASLKGYAGRDVTIGGLANAEAAASAPLVVLTVPFAAQITTIKSIRERLQPGSVLIDVTVPLEPAIGGRPTRTLGVWAGSAAEQCAELAPEGVQVVSAFHNAGSAALVDLQHDVECDIVVCGDDKGAKDRVKPLVEAIPGCRYVDGGLLANSRTVEAMTALLIGINIRYKVHSGIRITGI